MKTHFQWLKTTEPQHEFSAKCMCYCDLNYSLQEVAAMTARKVGGKKLALWGCGERAYISLKVLEEYGLRPDVIIENRPRTYTSSLDGIKVTSSWDIIENYDEWYIICASMQARYYQPIIDILIRNEIFEFGLLIEPLNTPHGEICLNLDSDIYVPDKELYISVLEKTMQNYLNDDFINLNIAGIMHTMTNIEWWRCSFDRIVREYKQYFSDLKLCECLDIGPGLGGLSYALMHKIGIDKIIFDIVIPEENETYHYYNKFSSFRNIIKANIETDIVESEKLYDIIILTEVMEHFNYNPIPTLMKISKLLKPTGRFFVCVPENKYFTPYYKTYRQMPFAGEKRVKKPDFDHNYMYKPDELKEIFKEAGFEIDAVELAHPNNTEKNYYTLVLANRG